MDRSSHGSPRREAARQQATSVPPSAAPDAGTAGLSSDKLQRFAAKAWASEWQAAGQVSPIEDNLYAKPDGYCWFWKPAASTAGFGLPALLCLIGQFFVPALNASCALPPAGSVDIVRAVLLFGGFALLMIASPVYRPREWSPQDDEQLLRDREVFRGKRRI